MNGDVERPEPLSLKPGKPERLLLGAGEVGMMLGLSKATVWAHHAAAFLPEPVKIGGSTRWRREEIEAWVREGCPPRAKWNWKPAGFSA